MQTVAGIITQKRGGKNITAIPSMVSMKNVAFALRRS
jgi:hypothetical protein